MTRKISDKPSGNIRRRFAPLFLRQILNILHILSQFVWKLTMMILMSGPSMFLNFELVVFVLLHNYIGRKYPVALLVEMLVPLVLVRLTLNLNDLLTS